MPGRLTRALGILANRSDLVVAIIVLLAVVMMIIPLPTWLVDALITVNIAASLLVLLVAFYVSRPVEFSSLPTVILLATLFRLAITITTSRLILLQADAGEIITAFGNFVIGGDIAVGLVIFLIITIAQFVVITKGSERVAEVAARFSLDALPGKQMSIDADLRNGDIDQATARGLRRALERESHLFGAMDGAMKFVKGDAIASIVVILVNLIGGLIVGTLRHGLTLAGAAETYSLLSVGDGLVAQIPSLLVSMAAGTVVTRVASERDRDVGSEIVGQFLNEPRALFLGAVVLLALAFVPGFPMPAFILLAAIVGAVGLWSRRRKATPHEAEGEKAESAAAASGSGPQTAIGTTDGERAEALPPPPTAPIVLRVGSELARAVPPAGFDAMAAQARTTLLNDLGIEAPAIALHVDEATGDDRFAIDFEGVPAGEGAIAPADLLVDDEPLHLDLLQVPYREGPPIVDRRHAIWVDRAYEAVLSEAGLAFASPLQVLARCLLQTLYRRASSFVGIQETRKLLAKVQPDYGELVKEAEKIAPLQKLAEILRRLVDENVPLRNLRGILEAVVEWGQREQNVVLLVEYVRMALGRQISFRYADGNRVIAAYMLERSVEDLLRSGARQTAVGTFLSIPGEETQPLIAQLRQLLAATAADARPVILASMDVRRLARALLTRNDIDLPVLSYQELAPEFNVQPLGTLTMEERPHGVTADTDDAGSVEPAWELPTAAA
jgi:type III secretion protein V